MAKKNSIIIKSFRIRADINDILKKAGEEIGLPKIDIIRILLNRSALQLKHDSQRAGGSSNLSFSLELMK